MAAILSKKVLAVGAYDLTTSLIVCTAQWSHKLMDTFENPTLITHPRGHVIPALEGDSLEKLRSFLMARQQDSAL